MSGNDNGKFSRNFFSLQLQLKALLEDAGGDNVGEVLDSLCRLNRSEQEIVLKIFNRVLQRLIGGDDRLYNAQDRERQEFEDNLFHEIVNSLQLAANCGHTHRLAVVDGGKDKEQTKEESLIDLEKARRLRKLRAKPVVTH